MPVDRRRVSALGDSAWSTNRRGRLGGGQAGVAAMVPVTARVERDQRSDDNRNARIEPCRATWTDIVPDSERRGLIGALPARGAALCLADPARPADRRLAAVLAGRLERGAGRDGRAGGWLLILWLALGAWAMRGAGCVYNDIVDRDLDAQVERTRLRPLASGRVSLTRRLGLLVALSLIGLVVLLQLDRDWRRSSRWPASLLVAAYPFMKRITWWPQAWLGLVFSWAALVGWPAVTGRLELPGAAALCGLDLLGDRLRHDLRAAGPEDDALVGVQILGAGAGPARAARRRDLLCRSRSLLWAAAFRAVRVEWFALLGLLPMALHLLWQVAALKPDDGADALAKFRSNRFAGLLMFVACLRGRHRLTPVAFGGRALYVAADAQRQ